MVQTRKILFFIKAVFFICFGSISLSFAQTDVVEQEVNAVLDTVEQSIPNKAVEDRGNASVVEEAEEFKKKTVEKEVEGEVAGISASFIAIDYGVNADGTAMQELALPVSVDVEIEFKKSINDISVGDIVSAVYEETTESNGKITKVLERIVKKIRFLRAAEKIQESPALQSTEQQV